MTTEPKREMTEEEAKAAKRRERIAQMTAEQRREATAELRAMDEVFSILHPLGEDATMRILRWVTERIKDFPSPRYYFDDEVPF